MSRDHTHNRLRIKKRSSRRHRPFTSPHQLPARSTQSLKHECERLSADDLAFYSAHSDDGQLEATLIPKAEEENFIERLHDAMADDEGAAYWEEFYAQPIHTTERPEDAMDDDEYAAYIRRGMWERRHKAQFDNREKASQSQHSKDRCVPEQEVSLDSQTQINKEVLKESWTIYLRAWEAKDRRPWTIDTVPWPVVSGSSIDISASSIKTFFTFAGDLETIAKQELRRRWHPDKFSQKNSGALKLLGDESLIMSKVTLVAQLLNEIRSDTTR